MVTKIDTITYQPAPAWHISNMKQCKRCAVKFDWRASHSTLKMTYCGILCEIGDLGFSLESLLG